MLPRAGIPGVVSRETTGPTSEPGAHGEYAGKAVALSYAEGGILADCLLYTSKEAQVERRLHALLGTLGEANARAFIALIDKMNAALSANKEEA